MTNFDSRYVLYPDFMPFQSLGVQVIPGCEECRFRIVALKPTIPKVEIYESGAGGSVPEKGIFDPTLSKDFLIDSSFGGSYRDTYFDMRVGYNLQQATRYMFSITTHDTTYGEAEIIGTFVTARREVVAYFNSIDISDSGDPHGGEIRFRIGLFGVVNGKSTERGGFWWPYLPGFGTWYQGVPHAANITDLEQIRSSYVPPYLRLVACGQDDDRNFLSLYTGGAADGYGGAAGRDIGYQPVNPAKGDDNGEWSRSVQEFSNLPQYPGTYEFPLTDLKTAWGVIYNIPGRLQVFVEAAPGGSISHNLDLTYGPSPVRFIRIPPSPGDVWPSNGSVQFRLSSTGEFYLGRSVSKGRHSWRHLANVDPVATLAYSGRESLFLAASMKGRLAVSSCRLAGDGPAHGKQLDWNITEEIYEPSLMPVIDDELVGLVFVGPEHDARFLALREGAIDESLRAVSFGGKDLRFVTCACAGAALSVFALDSHDVLWYARHRLPLVEGNPRAAWSPLSRGVSGFSVAKAGSEAHVFAVAADRGLRLMKLSLDTIVSEERHWLDFGTLDKPGLPAGLDGSSVSA